MTGSSAGTQVAPVGVLVMAYGTPASYEDIEAYYRHVRRGRPPTPEQLANLQRRYAAIGGTSPLTARTRAQVEGLQAVLDRARPGRFRVGFGAKHSPPFIEDGVAELARAGVGRIVGLVLAPHYSALSVGEYAERAQAAGARAGLQVDVVPSWHLAPGLIELLAERLTEAMAGLPAQADMAGLPAQADMAGLPAQAPGAGGGAGVATRAEVLVTAHSLPSRILDQSDPYPDQLRATAEAVTARAGVRRWRLAWQSAGRTPEPWLGPDVLDVIRTLATEGAGAVVVCPAGFTSDHLEVLYDVDIEARRVAEELGLVLVRTASLNDDPRLLATLAQVVMDAHDEATRGAS